MLSSSCLKTDEPSRTMTRSRVSVWLLFAVLACAFNPAQARASASPDWQAQLGQQPPRVCGQGNFRFFGFAVYEATLFGSCVSTVFDAPFALKLHYKRSISREQLVQSSVDEIVRIQGSGIDTSTLQKWQAQMEQAFVDVHAGDTIMGVYLPGQGAQFFVNDVFKHRVDDPAFARAFFGIWLDRDTRAPGLRSSLLGQSK